jgi:hypothetical protein
LPIIDSGYIVYEAKKGSLDYSLYLFNIEKNTTKQINNRSYDNFTVSLGSVYWADNLDDNETTVYGYDFNKE